MTLALSIISQVAVVRQTETAALRKASKSLKSCGGGAGASKKSGGGSSNSNSNSNGSSGGGAGAGGSSVTFSRAVAGIFTPGKIHLIWYSIVFRGLFTG